MVVSANNDRYVVGVDFGTLSGRALDALVERIAHGGGPGDHLRVPPEFVVRASAAPPAGAVLRQAGA